MTIKQDLSHLISHQNRELAEELAGAQTTHADIRDSHHTIHIQGEVMRNDIIHGAEGEGSMDVEFQKIAQTAGKAERF